MVFVKLLIKCFGQEFFKINAGFLITSFSLLIGYGLFIKTAGHIPEGQALTINFTLLLQFLQAPIITLIACLMWLIYSIKCWRYLWRASLQEDQLFWRYSLSACSFWRQFTSFLLFQFYLFVPLYFYWSAAALYGLLIQSYKASLFSGLYLLALTVISAVLYLYRFNVYPYGKATTRRRISPFQHYSKPLFSFFLLDMLHRRKLSLLFTKSFSLLLMIGFYQLFTDVDQPATTAGIIALSITVAHSILAYQDGTFTESHLYFLRQLPHRRSLYYFHRFCTYGLLIFPEIIWFLYAVSSPIATLLLCISSILFIRSIRDIPGLHMRVFLKWVFGFFFTTIILLLYNLSWYVTVINFLFGTGMFYYWYYRHGSIAIK